MREPSRRETCGAALCGLVGAALGCGRPGKGVESAPDTGPAGCDLAVPDPADPAWVEIALSDYPELAEVGGQVAVSVPDALLEVVVAQPSAGCFIAVWRICTHGACEVTWEAETRDLLCPCHGSRFGEDGAVLEGPATEALRVFPAARLGDSVWVYRPL